MKKKFVKVIVAMLGVCMLAGCGKKDDANQVQAGNVAGTAVTTEAPTEAPTEPKKATVEEIYNFMQEENKKYLVVMDDVMKDDTLDKDEVFQLMELIPEGVMTVNFDVDGAMVLTQDGTDMNMSGSAAGKVDLSFDTDDHEVGADVEVNLVYDAAMLGTSGSQKVKCSFYLVNEDGNYYLYNQMGTQTAQRQLLGNLDEVIAEGFDISEMKEALGGKTYTEFCESVMTDDMVKFYTLSDDMVTYNGTECYHLIYTMTGDQLIEIMKKSFADMQLEDGVTMEDALKQELAAGYTVEDLYKEFNLTYNYYITKDDFKVVYADCDMTDMMNKIITKVIEISMAEMSAATETEMKVAVDVKKCYFDYSFVEKDLDVKFEGEFEDVVPETDIYGLENMDGEVSVEMLPLN